MSTVLLGSESYSLEHWISRQAWRHARPPMRHLARRRIVATLRREVPQYATMRIVWRMDAFADALTVWGIVGPDAVRCGASYRSARKERARLGA